MRIDPASAEPPFAQLRRQILERITEGELAPGDRLPPVRRLAQELDIAVNTVARAYRELEADGVLEGRGRAGTFVRAGVVEGQATSAIDSAREGAHRYAQLAHSLDLDAETAVALVREALER